MWSPLRPCPVTTMRRVSFRRLLLVRAAGVQVPSIGEPYACQAFGESSCAVELRFDDHPAGLVDESPFHSVLAWGRASAVRAQYDRQADPCENREACGNCDCSPHQIHPFDMSGARASGRAAIRCTSRLRRRRSLRRRPQSPSGGATSAGSRLPRRRRGYSCACRRS